MFCFFLRKRYRCWRNQRNSVVMLSNEVGSKNDNSVIKSFLNQNNILCDASNIFESKSFSLETVSNTELENVIYSYSYNTFPLQYNLSESEGVSSQTNNVNDADFENVSGLCSDLVCENSSNSSMLDDEYQFDKKLWGDIKSLALKHSLTRQCINDLIQIFVEKGCSMPKDSRTLLGTKQSNIIQLKNNDGKYIYFGIKSNLERVLTLHNHNSKKINLKINIDGIPL